MFALILSTIGKTSPTFSAGYDSEHVFLVTVPVKRQNVEEHWRALFLGTM